MPASEFYTLDDALWDRLNEMTEGAISLCYQCGVCTAACPWGSVRKEPLSVRSMVRRAQLGLHNGDKNVWLCTTCAQCVANCPRGVNIVQVFRSLRELAWEQRRLEKGLPSLLWSIYWNGNPWSQPPSRRPVWAKGQDIPIFDPEKHEILLYVGCTSSYDRRAQQISRALVKVLQAAEVRFGYLGEDEPCCGEAALSLGHRPFFQEIAGQTTRRLQERSVGEMVVISPHCYDAFYNHYPPAAETGITPLHYTQYLARVLEQGRLQYSHSLPKRITFQDPCYLGRHNRQYEAPRDLLRAIPEVELVEMEHNGIDGLCCGGGGGRMWLETPAEERFANLRIVEALRVEADILATACPFCVVCLEDSARSVKGRQLRVLDIAEILAEVVEIENSGIGVGG